MMRPTPVEDQGFDLQGWVDELQAFVWSAAEPTLRERLMGG
jgi:hypothetical protein